MRGRIVSRELLERARALRRGATRAEGLVWAMLRGRRLAGLKFRRQHAIPPFVADFYCEEAKLVVELDGGRHADCGEYDARRTAVIEQQGLRVIRIRNVDAIADLEAVGLAILNAAGVDVPHFVATGERRWMGHE